MGKRTIVKEAVEQQAGEWSWIVRRWEGKKEPVFLACGSLRSRRCAVVNRFQVCFLLESVVTLPLTTLLLFKYSILNRLWHAPRLYSFSRMLNNGALCELNHPGKSSPWFPPKSSEESWNNALRYVVRHQHWSILIRVHSFRPTIELFTSKMSILETTSKLLGRLTSVPI